VAARGLADHLMASRDVEHIARAFDFAGAGSRREAGHKKH
jgi:hypothetical protein